MKIAPQTHAKASLREKVFGRGKRANAGRYLVASVFAACALAWIAVPARGQVYYEQNANGQLENYPGSDSANTFNYPSDNNWSQSLVTGTDPVNNESYEEAPSNWSTPTYPNSASTNVVINALPVTLDVSVTVDSLTLSNGAAVDMLSGNTLDVSGSLTDNGSIVVNSDQNNANSVLNFVNAEVSGTGTITLNYSGTHAQVNGTLTQDSGHTIAGYGDINAALTNNGLVNANSSGQTLTLETNPMSNNGIMESSGGLLDVNGIAVTQGTNGQLIANGSNVQFDGNTTINGGALNTTSNGGVFVVNTGSATFSGVTNNSTVDVRIGTSLLISGTLTNNGTVFVNPNASPGVALIKFNNAELTGSGAVNLGSNGTTAQLSGTLTQDVSHTIEGFGDITATLTNNGLVTANAANQTLEVNGPTTNGSTGTMQANGGTLSFASGALTNLSGSTLTGGTYEVKATSTLTLPGTITTNNASVILRSTTSTFAAINSLATNDGEFAVFGGRSFTTAGNLTNAGMLTTGPTSSLTTSGTLNQTSTGMLEGAGTFTAKSFTLAGTVSPGVSTNYTPNEPGTLTLDGTTTFSSSLSLVLTLGSTSSSTNDHLVVNGKFTLDGILSINATAGFGTGLYDIIDYSGGTFVNDTLSIGSDMPAGFNYEILTNDPGQVDLMVTAIPEPATWAMALAGLGVLCLRKRFRGELRQ